MKYEGEKQIGEDKDFTSYLFSFREKELELLHKILEQTHRYFPKTTETQVTRSRLSTILKTFRKVAESIVVSHRKRNAVDLSFKKADKSNADQF